MNKSEPHKIVVRCWIGESARFADVHWNEETSKVLRECYQYGRVYYVNSATAREICLRNEIK